ncbi:c-type cytochrome [Engelhardtia mirabilis]|uniref:Cytochrome c domain-containing protein n=1 Tax=Engelhardtia mirabilis TaxID=2528011 RepID=A0A518BJ10_9BACT|nr:hypothetical protein Pla133_20090 [Planctomycetes bacterium Pla133]QDV01260.1 hypothetical protein Pla86_20090 [Planctomycetes bacterium Pla86]
MTRPRTTGSPAAATAVLFAAAALALAGCSSGGGAATYQWGLAPEVRAKLAGDPEAIAQVEATLVELFGTPAAPRPAPLADGSEPWLLTIDSLSERLAKSVRIDNAHRFHDDLAALASGQVIGVDWSEVIEDQGEVWAAAVHDGGDGKAIAAQGEAYLRDWLPSPSRSERIYKSQCVTCHGIEGGGNGPSATYLQPPPRDFRSGAFKYFHESNGPRPRRDDLVDVIYDGVRGSGMAAFRSIAAPDLIGLADYVRFLSVRGVTEAGLAEHLAAGSELTPEVAAAIYAEAWEPWLAALNTTSPPEVAEEGTR